MRRETSLPNEAAVPRGFRWDELVYEGEPGPGTDDEHLHYLIGKYGAPSQGAATSGLVWTSFQTPAGELALLRKEANNTILAGWRLWRGDLCQNFGPAGLATATGSGSSSFVPLLGSAAMAVAAATAAAGISAGQSLWAAIDRGCVGRCQPPCTCQAVPLVPPPPAITYAAKTILGVPVLVTVSASLTLSALLLCA